MGDVIEMFPKQRVFRTALFSPCMEYRYTLMRQWDSKLKRVNFIMLNPSTADEKVNDPTVERCQRRASMMGFGTLDVTNLFALRSTSPTLLYTHKSPVGDYNDAHILTTAKTADLVVVAWGNHGAYMDRGAQVLSMLLGNGVKPHCLALTKINQPQHPLYVSYEVEPKLMSGGVQCH